MSGPGRPPLKPGQPSTPVHVRVPDDEYDRACRRVMRERGDSVPDLIRRALKKYLDDDEE